MRPSYVAFYAENELFRDLQIGGFFEESSPTLNRVQSRNVKTWRQWIAYFVDFHRKPPLILLCNLARTFFANEFT